MKGLPSALAARIASGDFAPSTHPEPITGTPANAPRWALPLLAVAFVLSGAAGLIYESIWTRYLGLFVGHSAYAQIIVLVIFLGGMSLGAWSAAERSARLRHPLLWYAAIELAVGVIGFAFHDAYVAVTAAAYDRWFPALAGGAALTIVKWGLAALLILPQSILLGTTFPLMSAGVIRLRTRRAGHVLGLLYFANSLGAALGVLAAGFWLLGSFGLPGTLASAAFLNLTVAALVGLPVLRGELADHRALDDEPPSETAGPMRWVPARLLLIVSFGTALSSFIYEIGWIRMLSLVLGSATHSFELMLSAFILGLALGAFWVRRRADRYADPVRALGVVQWSMGVLAIATLPVYVASFGLMATLHQAFRASDTGYDWFVVARYAICLAVMLPATFCAGMTLPLITRTLLQGGMGERAIGRVYAVNTLGSIVGAAAAGLVLMPLVGLKWLLVLGALVDIALAVLLLAPRADAPDETGHSRGPALPSASLESPARAAAFATVALVVVIAVFVRFDHTLLSSGVYRHGTIPTSGLYEFLYYRDGRTATVSVRRSARDTNSYMTLATNGKPDASMEAIWRRPPDPSAPRVPLVRDLSTQVLLPIVTLAHAPQAREAAVIGQGSGMTSHFLLGSPRLRDLYTVEIEPDMIAASRAFMPANRRVFEDPRAHFVIDDAKSFFAASGKRFDLILSEPSNPWVSGVSGLFTAEFYEHVKRRLADDGVFGQWLHLYEIDDVLVLSVLAALDRTFPSYEVFLTSDFDLLVVASKRAQLPAPEWRVVDDPGIREDLRRVTPFTPASLESLRLISRDVLHPYLQVQSIVNSDYFPFLDLGTERTRFLHTTATGIVSLANGRFDIVGALSGRRQPLAGPHEAPAPEIRRVRRESIASRLRALRDAGAVRADTIRDEDLRLAYYRYQRFTSAFASAPPADWRLWAQDFDGVEQDLHMGSAGVADERFYGTIRAFLARAGAPDEARAAVEFHHALATWTWADAVRAGAVLTRALVQHREQWVPLDLLREGLVVANLRLGDAAAASAVFKTLAPFGAAAPTFRDRVLAGSVLAAERQRLGAR
jgi:spermidine synthase